MSTVTPTLKLTAEEFFNKIIRGELGARGLVEGPNFFFGPETRLVRAIAWRRLWSVSGLSRYMTLSAGASKPVSSLLQTMTNRSGSAGSWKRGTTFGVTSSGGTW